MEKYRVGQFLVETLLSDIETGQISIPEMQRPFVWSSVKVRDLIDSLYNEFPVGYIVTWKNPEVRTKDGKLSDGRKVLIDGQQRVTALSAAIKGKKIVDKDYKKKRIIISYNPLIEKFETQTPAILKNSEWIPDISIFLESNDFVGTFNNYIKDNPSVDAGLVQKNLQKLADIKKKMIGHIELDHSLDIQTVTEIFIRINSKGVVLSQSDFAMSKIASYGLFGSNLRKLIDYFAHLSKYPEYFNNIAENDEEFNKTEYLQKISWLKNIADDLYDPDYSDIIRVAFLSKFGRGKISDLVALLSGRDFVTRENTEAIQKDSYNNFEKGILEFVNEYDFKNFVQIIRSAGFISASMISSQNALNFSYVVYLKLKDRIARKDGSSKFLEHLVRRWFVMSVLTKRYSGSAESTFDNDIKNIIKFGVEKYLSQIEQESLSDNFWSVVLVNEMEKSSTSAVELNTFFASQVKNGSLGFLSEAITVRDMISGRGDIHHVFPKNYLMKKFSSRNDYNQIANFVYAPTNINVQIGNKAPKDYFTEILNQCDGGGLKYGTITDIDILKKNLRAHAIPEEIFEMTIDDYPKFIEERRKLMARKIEKYYKSL